MANNNDGCLSVFLPFLKKKEKQIGALPYRIRDDFLSPAELSFYKVLASIVGTRLVIQSKVRLADIFFVSRPNENRAYFGKISQKHLDFLVCDPKTMKPLFGIELDDSSHKRSDRQKRDVFVNNVFRAANLPLLRFPVQRSYTRDEIVSKIAPLFKKDKSNVEKNTQNEIETLSSAPICPKCNIPMVLRTVKKGKHLGKRFYGCQNFPQCSETQL
ncbi:MAG: DUF2726 domain-containing protein [Chloroflexi bacterium]|nr:DUF2726 domain-containing protein [Chloroflexota bacterium]